MNTDIVTTTTTTTSTDVATETPVVPDKPKRTRKPRVVPAGIDAAVAAFTAAFPAVTTVPAWFRAFAAGIIACNARVDAAPATTAASLVSVFADAANAAVPVPPVPAGSTAGRWSGMGIRYGQNAIYVAFAATGVPCKRMANAVIMAAWRAEYPNAKCDYVNRDYAAGTLAEFVGNRHGDVPGVPTARSTVARWYADGPFTGTEPTA